MNGYKCKHGIDIEDYCEECVDHESEYWQLRAEAEMYDKDCHDYHEQKEKL